MSCCGTPKGVKDLTNHAPLQNGQMVNQQPSPHPGLYQEKQFQPPSIPSPVPTHPYDPRGFSQSQHGSPSPPPPSQFGGMPANFQSPYSTMQSPLLQPTPAHSRGDSASPGRMSMMSPMTSSTPINGGQPSTFHAPSDEGKMSISIDFGESQLLLQPSA